MARTRVQNAGHSRRTRSERVTMASKSSSRSSRMGLDRWPEISTSDSAITRTALGSSPWASIPAECGSIERGQSFRAQPSAIWLRQELPEQRKRIFNIRCTTWLVLLAEPGMQFAYRHDGYDSQHAVGNRLTRRFWLVLHRCETSDAPAASNSTDI